MVKPRLYNEDGYDKGSSSVDAENGSDSDALKLLHPYMPFITEEIFCTLQDGRGVHHDFCMAGVSGCTGTLQKKKKQVETIKEAVRAIRNVRTGMNVPPSKKAQVFVVSENPEVREIFETGKVFFATLGYASSVHVQADKSRYRRGCGIRSDSAKAVIYMPFAELVDIDKGDRASEEGRGASDKRACPCQRHARAMKSLSAKHRQAKIDEEKAKLAKYTQMMDQVKARLAQLA